MRERGFVESVNAAVEGFIYVVRTQRNMRVHFLAAVMILLCGIFLNLSTHDLMLLFITITMVLVAEMANTAVELIVDMVKKEVHPTAKAIKDVCAGAVLVTAVNAIIIGYTLFSKQVSFRIEDGIFRLRQSPWHITFMSIIIVFAFTMAGKIIFHRGTPMRGGMPSGHAAVAFSMWTIVAFLTSNPIITILTFVMAFLIARHRIKDSIHTVLEVFAGGIMGVLVTTLIFQIFH